MIHEINANLLEHSVDGIIHSCNCFHTFGGGIALQIRNKWSSVFEADLKTKKGDKNKLGTFSVAILPSNLHVFNMYGQYTVGMGRQTNYDAVVRGLEGIKNFALLNGLKSLGLPKYMGCGLGGGNWSVIRAIIDEVFLDSSIDITICCYDPTTT